MNPASILKFLSAKKQFEDNHPKFEAFVRTVLSRPLEEVTVLVVTVTRPGEKPMTGNIKLLQSDLELLAELKELSEHSR